MNASSPAFEFSFANSGITGTGTFSALPFASAGLYAADVGGLSGVAEAVGTEALVVGDVVVEPVSEGGSLGVLPPWQPVRSRARTKRRVADERRGMTGSPAAVLAMCRPV
ncbi:hypothetical protein [Arthrobacter sp. YN]|uniref:hypothetical protein n=1 Tax=Arthrobacter sp. YN TaxID=2020486 RepID=UPI0012FDA57F|nr:hypothetical protein [Arthrobacter sp. YN]